jgi:PAS domain-containing protein
MRRRPLGSLSAARRGRARALAWLLAPLLALAALATPHAPALALKPIAVTPDQDRIEITTLGEIYESRGDSLQIETVGGDGLTSRMTVGAATPGTNPNWLVFALSNPNDKPIERWLTAERYTVLGSGAVRPDLDARRIEAVTPSRGFVPERIKSDRADVFRITLEPGQTITYVTELASDRLARVYLWKPLDYELKVRERQLVNGIMLGATGLLAVFLTAIFAANHKVIFPASALVAYCVLAYLCIDFGFFHKLFQLRPEETAVHRAAAEAALAASLVIFLYTFLRLGLGHGLVRMVMLLWIVAQLALVAVAVIDPRLASTFARLSLVAIGAVGGLLTLYLALRGQDRALSLIPSWLLFLVWLFLAGVILGGRLAGEMATLGLAGGLVVILLIVGVTVTQYAFRSLEPLYGAAPTELQTRSLAIDGAGAAVWEWNARRDEVKVHPMIEAALGLAAGELSTKVEDFAKHLHVADRERFRLMLWSIQERSGGRIRSDFRLRQADNSYRWFELEAASVASTDRRAVRCVGLMRDVTEARRSHERCAPRPSPTSAPRSSSSTSTSSGRPMPRSGSSSATACF